MAQNDSCPCTNDCPRHGDCAACRESHASRPYPPRCERKGDEEV